MMVEKAFLHDSFQPIAVPKAKSDELFLQWISDAPTLRLLEDSIESLKIKGKDTDPLLSPARSPRKGIKTHFKRYNKAFRGMQSKKTSPEAKQKDSFSPAIEIPRFYFPIGAQLSKRSPKEEEFLAQLKQAFEGTKKLEKKEISKVMEILGLPQSVSMLVLHNSDPSSTMMSKDEVSKIFLSRLAGRDPAQILFDVLRQPKSTVLQPSDFRPLVRLILETHPGLSFLQSTLEFQERYLETVIVRIFYNIRFGHTGRISLSELRKSSLINNLIAIDAEPDINKNLDFFSYEHFYVIYCKFWELDTDHDLVIDTDDLARYAEESLTRRVVERVSSLSIFPRDAELSKVVALRARKSRPGAKLMTYQDFVWFILSEEDKSTATAQEYWFRVIDVDGDGCWSAFELESFYNSTVPKLRELGSEPPPFRDLLCQWLDMLSIQNPQATKITLQDLRSSKLAPAILNALVNPSKFLALETKDPFVIDPPDAGSDWVKFAQIEYEYATAEQNGSDSV